MAREFPLSDSSHLQSVLALKEGGSSRVCADSPGCGLWNWQSDKDHWYSSLASRIASYEPSGGLVADVSAIRPALHEAAERRAPWLFHPCLAALYASNCCEESGDFQLIYWLARHCSMELGSIRLSRPIWAWLPGGGIEVAPGDYKLRELAQRGEAAWPLPIALDIWADCTGGIQSFPFIPQSWLWPSYRPLNEVDKEVVERLILKFASTVNFLFSRLPNCARWVETVTKVVLPLRGDGGDGFHSGSSARIPGIVYLDIDVPGHNILEALVHESAHQHFFLAEAVTPLVDPGHAGLHESPLRADPRPLRGVFLAYHALAYMCALYSELIKLNAIEDGAEATDLNARALAAEKTLEENLANLTACGQSYYYSTRQVRRYGH